MTVTSSEFLFTKLRCPVCGQAMDTKEASAICRGLSAHCFDFAKSGYLNLTAGHGGMGDLKDATDARHRFLSKGYYSILSDRIVELLSEAEPSSILDAGCGEGSYTNKLAAVAPVIGIDLSKSGILLAAKEAKRQSLPALYLVASLFTLPVANESFSAVTNLFAPCAEAEFCRILEENGLLLVVGAGKEHLMGLKRTLYDDPRINPGREDLPNTMQLIKKETLTGNIRVAKEDIEDLFAMTPYYFRTSKKDHDKLSGLEYLDTEIAFDLFLYRKN